MARSCLTERARYGDGMTGVVTAKLLKRSEITIRRKIKQRRAPAGRPLQTRAEPGADRHSAGSLARWGIALLAGGGAIVSSYALFITVGHVHAAASGVGLLIAFVVLAFLFGGGKSGGSSSK